MASTSPDLDAKLVKQIEYYFSDSNFRHDKFLRAKAAEDSDGYVALTVLLTFNRVKAMTGDVEVIAKALEASTTLELSSDRTSVRRTAPLPEEDNSQQRSVYVVSRVAGAETTASSVWRRARKVRGGAPRTSGTVWDGEPDTAPGAAALAADGALRDLPHARGALHAR